MSSGQPLSGLRVLDFAWIGAGALVTKALAELGAEIIRIESRARPDNLRKAPPFRPGATGLDVARQVQGRSHVVFVTAYDQYAVSAFDEGAVDYLLKPLEPARLFTAIQRVKQRMAGPPADLSAVLSQLGAQAGKLPQRQFLRWINASVGQTLKLITVDEVLYFQSDNKYTRVATRQGEALIRKPLKELVDELDPQQFWQIHRSTLVNAAAVAGVSRDFRGRMQVKLKESEDALIVAESYTHLFRQM